MHIYHLNLLRNIFKILEKLNKQIQVYVFVSHQKRDSCFTHDECLQKQTNYFYKQLSNHNTLIIKGINQLNFR